VRLAGVLWRIVLASPRLAVTLRCSGGCRVRAPAEENILSSIFLGGSAAVAVSARTLPPPNSTSLPGPYDRYRPRRPRRPPAPWARLLLPWSRRRVRGSSGGFGVDLAGEVYKLETLVSRPPSVDVNGAWRRSPSRRESRARREDDGEEKWIASWKEGKGTLMTRGKQAGSAARAAGTDSYCTSQVPGPRPPDQPSWPIFDRSSVLWLSEVAYEDECACTVYRGRSSPLAWAGTAAGQGYGDRGRDWGCDANPKIPSARRCACRCDSGPSARRPHGGSNQLETVLGLPSVAPSAVHRAQVPLPGPRTSLSGQWEGLPLLMFPVR